jgi:hypothetical protein
LIYFLAFKEIRNAFDLFKKTTEEKNDVLENNSKREEISLDSKIMNDNKTKDKCSLKEKRNTRDETDTWAYIAAEGDQEVSDSVCQTDETSGKFAWHCSHRVISECAPHYLLFSQNIIILFGSAE